MVKALGANKLKHLTEQDAQYLKIFGKIKSKFLMLK